MRVLGSGPYWLRPSFMMWAWRVLAIGYSKIHSSIGLSKAGICGGGSLPTHVDKFYEAIGMKVQVGYGLTEASPVNPTATKQAIDDDGENVEPEQLEEAALRSNLIQQIVVIGQDQRRLGAIIVPNKEEILASKRLSTELSKEQITGLLSEELRKCNLYITFLQVIKSRLCDTVALPFRCKYSVMTGYNRVWLVMTWFGGFGQAIFPQAISETEKDGKTAGRSIFHQLQTFLKMGNNDPSLRRPAHRKDMPKIPTRLHGMED
nr:probable acyl-activating enzyme 16, chloroplastic [Tanacetum cinerariifolium]